MKTEIYISTELPSYRARIGVASLPTIAAVIILILAIAVGITGLALTEAFIAAGQTNSTVAFFYAEAGARDALQRIARDKTFATSSYQISFVTDGCTANDGCATVTVSTASGTSANPKVITSKGQAKSSVRRVQVDVIFDASLHGEIATSTWREVTD